MTLRKKALLIIGVTLISTVFLVYVASRFTLMEDLLEIEEYTTHQSAEQAMGALSYVLSDLEANTADLASWDDTYAFIEDPGNEYIQSNIVDETFINLRLNLIMFIHSSGEVVLSKAFDLNNERETAIPPGMQKYLSEDGLFQDRPGTETGTSGIIMLDETPMLIASKPILTGDDTGPSRGTLIFGRYLDATEIKRLSQMIFFPLTIHRIDDIRTRPGFQDALLSLKEETPIFVQPLNDQYIAGYALIQDIFEKPVLVMRVDLPRDIYRAGQASVAYHILLLLGIGLLVAGAAMLIIQKQILSRFANLIRGINRIGTSGDISTRISMGGADELSVVAGTINGMLGALQQSGSVLRESEERLASFMNSATDSFSIWDSNLNLVEMNKVGIGMFPAGTKKEDITGKNISELVPNTKETGRYDKYMEVIKTGKALALDDIVPHSKFGDIHLSMRAFKVGDGLGIIATDITKRKKDERELLKSEKKLRRLYKYERDLRQKLEEEIGKRVEFTRALVHELKTPITPVLASSELLLEELPKGPLAGLVRNINQGALNLNRRIDELLDLAKSELGTIELNPEFKDPLRILNNIAESVTPLAQRNRLSLNFESPPSLSSVWIDEDRFRQVVLNLLNNALKFTPEGGRITLKASEDDANLIVEVQDTGHGISKKEQERIFEPYHKMESDRARLSGLGLGLSLSKNLVELQGGQIWVKSQKDKGSTFGFSIPLGGATRQEKDAKKG